MASVPRCPACGAPAQASRCAACLAAEGRDGTPRYGVTRAGGESPASPPSLTFGQAEAPPAGWSEADDGRGSVVLTRRWFQLWHAPGLLATLWIVADAAGDAAAVVASSRLDRVELGVGAVVALILGGLLYSEAAHLVNRSVFTVRGGAIDVRHGPLWWPGARRYAPRTFVGFHADPVPVRVNGVRYYRVRGISRSREVVPVGGWMSEASARFLAGRLGALVRVDPASTALPERSADRPRG